jgi:hypothetical protein
MIINSLSCSMRSKTYLLVNIYSDNYVVLSRGYQVNALSTGPLVHQEGSILFTILFTPSRNGSKTSSNECGKNL